jgi:hypothetical protein
VFGEIDYKTWNHFLFLSTGQWRFMNKIKFEWQRTVFKKKIHKKCPPPPGFELRPLDSVPWVVTQSQISLKQLCVYFHTWKQDANKLFCTRHKRQKKLSRRCICRSLGENHHSFGCTNQKSNYIANRLIHCAIGTLVGLMFTKLLFFSCYTQKLLSLLYVWDDPRVFSVWICIIVYLLKTFP